jgi:hypothetical protein
VDAFVGGDWLPLHGWAFADGPTNETNALEDWSTCRSAPAGPSIGVNVA